MENGLCVTTVKTCLLGMKQQADGKCCADRTSEACYPSLDRSCGTEAQPGVSICAGNPLYADIFSRIRVEEASRDENAAAPFGKALVNVYLPRFDLGDTPTGAARVEEKQTLSVNRPLFGRPLLDKSVILPKCFAKCCQSQEDQTCAPPTLKREYVEPNLACPKGCALPAGGRCICGTAAPAPCPAGTKECALGSSRICVPRENVFGIDSCKMASLLINHLPLVGCPSK